MRFRFAFLVLPFAAALLAGACNGEGEGMPCDTRAGNGGNDDCANGLVCTSGLSNAQGARCCPQNRQNATTPECSLGSATSDAASPAPPDASGGDGPAPSEASSGGGEASSDAPAEAAAEAGGGGDGSSSTDGATE
jgi:hypothetical protein